MVAEIQPLQERIKTIGKVLWIFSICWLVFNAIGLLIVVATVIGLRVAGNSEHRGTVVETFSGWVRVPEVSQEAIQNIVSWDYDKFLDNFWLTLFQATATLIIFVVTMVLIMKIARAMMKGDILSDPAVKSLHILGWLYLIHGIVGQLWGMAGQFIVSSHTLELLYFSFIQDVCLYSFGFSGTGIEWGLLVLAISSILKHARILRDEQLLVV